MMDALDTDARGAPGGTPDFQPGRGWLRRLLADRRGAAAVIAGLTVPVLMGAAGLAIEANMLLLQAHRLQVAADAAAYEAALMLGNATTQANSPASYKTIATNAVASVSNGALIGAGLTVAAAPAADFSTITVTLTTSQASLFSAVLGQGLFNLSASAKAGAPSSTPCVLSLATGNVAQAIYAFQGGEITGSGCTVFANSSSSSALYLNNGGAITGKTIGAAGGSAVGANGGTYSPTPQTGQSVVTETSYSGITVPSYGGCTQTNYTLYSGTMSPGVYCGANGTVLGQNSSTSVTMSPGTYYFVNSNLNIQTSPVNGSGVTLVFVGSSPGTLTWSNGGSSTLTAPTSGAFAGLVVYQACASNKAVVTNTLTGSETVTISGGIYMPCGNLTMLNGAYIETASGSTAKVEAYQFYIHDGAKLDITGAGGGTTAANVSLMQ